MRTAVAARSPYSRPEGPPLGAPVAVPMAQLSSARAGHAFSASYRGTTLVWVPVRLPSGTVVGVVSVPGNLLTAGVWKAWLVLAAVGVAILGLALLLSDRLGRSLVRSIEDLDTVTRRLSTGDLDARAVAGGTSGDRAHGPGRQRACREDHRVARARTRTGGRPLTRASHPAHGTRARGRRPHRARGPTEDASRSARPHRGGEQRDRRGAPRPPSADTRDVGHHRDDQGPADLLVRSGRGAGSPMDVGAAGGRRQGLRPCAPARGGDRRTGRQRPGPHPRGRHHSG